MKTAVVFYSLTGNTAYAAERIAEKLGADLVRVEPVKPYPTAGFRKFFVGGKSSVMKEKPELKPYEFRAADYDCIVVGMPVWASGVTPPIRTFIAENREALAGKQIAAFVCCSGGGTEKALGRLLAASGADAFRATLTLVDPKARPSAENDEKIAAFCASLS